ncbi:MAG: cyclase family protein [Chloroflexi bacterium]|nr:cyclase family protein [Chloroflexota bacterium]
MPGPDGLPLYNELPEFPAGERYAWDVFGKDNDYGTVNFIGPEQVKAAAGLVKRGVTINLDLPLDMPRRAPVPEGERGRGPIEHVVFTHRGGGDDRLDNFYLQGSSQWDGLRHVRYRENGYYHGLQDDDLANSDRLGIHLWAERGGINGRGVLLDVPRYLGERFQPGVRIGVDAAMIEAIAKQQGVEIRRGDILLFRTGWMTNYMQMSEADRLKPETMEGTQPVTGLEGDAETMAWLWDHRIAAVVGDNIACEATPVNGNNFQHRRLLAMFGMPIGELWWLDALADDCAQDGVYEFFLVTQPLNLPRGVGSPPNAVAIK